LGLLIKNNFSNEILIDYIYDWNINRELISIRKLNTKSNKIGLWTSTALVVGNMIGAGVFLLPASLANFGGISIFGWIFSAIGSLLLAKLFSNLSKKLPKSGGPYAYTKLGLGDFAAFLVAWGYWISIWCTNAAITVALVSYLSVFIPSLPNDPVLSIAIGLSIIWIITYLNTRGIKTAGKIQVVTTILKLVPLVLVAIAGLFYIDLSNFVPFNVSGESNFSAITLTATLTLFAFLGMESATIPADNIKNPEKTIASATMIGTLITVFVYIMGTVALMGMIPAEELQNSNAPFADAAAIIWGESARYWVAAGAIISTLGALNGWILMQGQIPLAASKDKLFPSIFGKENKNNTPAIGIVISSILVSILMMMNFSKGLIDTFTFIILLSTLTCLVPYLFSAASYVIICMQDKLWKNNGWISKIVIAFLAFLYSLWAVVGSGQESVYWGFILLMAGIPFYVWIKYKNNLN
jgi:APA family basic amino acid/polyamine antiporter